MNRVAIIPARGGSKRLPRKNILPLGGKPIISYPIEAALESKLFDDVVVSTEDEEIFEVASKYGATVIRRPDFLSRDDTPVVEVCRHVLTLKEYERVDSFCCLYATAAFISGLDLINSNKLMHSKPEADYVMGVSSYNYHPVQALKGEDGYLRSMWPEFNMKRSQLYPELVVSNGTLYWARTKEFLRDGLFYGHRLKGYNSKSLDIDTGSDYKRAQQIIENKNHELFL